jgi:hypothetical protein
LIEAEEKMEQREEKMIRRYDPAGTRQRDKRRDERSRCRAEVIEGKSLSMCEIDGSGRKSTCRVVVH